jgi:hypothetical protein
MDMTPTGGLLPLIPGMMEQRMTRLNPRWASALMIDFAVMSPITDGPDMCMSDYEHMDNDNVCSDYVAAIKLSIILSLLCT